MTTPDLRAGARSYLQRWTDWLAANPDADPRLVARLMDSGQPPPDTDQAKSEREQQQQEIAARRRARVTDHLTKAQRNLTTLQRRFLIEYLSQLRPNAAQAYRDAGGTADNAEKAAYKIRHHPNVVQAIDEYFHAQEMSAAEVVARLSQQAGAGYAAYLTVSSADQLQVDVGRMLAEGMGHLIKGVKQGRDGEQIIEFYDAQTALVHVGRYHGLFTDNTDLTSGGEKLTINLEWGDSAIIDD
jgi:hypothetical protein